MYLLRKKSKDFLYLLLGIWIVINLIQAAYLGLDPDEAYYWVYSQHLDWGYFDHPPVIALLIHLGSAIAGGTLGIRLLIPLLSAGTLILLWDLVGRPQKKKDIFLLILLFAAMPLLQVYAFVATPDVPLLFFSALFFWSYQRFLRGPSLVSSLWWALVMAALLYSKYHGILLIFFTLISNWRLLKQPYFYLAGTLGALLFLPHLYWQYIHDFPSFRYHLSGRDDPYELKHSINYLLNQLLIFSPLLFPFIVRALWKQEPKYPLERSLRYVIFGFWSFFFYTTFKGHVEPQWTVILSLPFILLLYWKCQQDKRFRHLATIAAMISTGILLLARIVMIWPDSGVKTPFNQNRWIAGLREETKGEPLIFQNSYRNAAMYQFYTGDRAYTFTDNCYRRNQYDIFDWEKELQNKSVWMVGNSTWNNPEAKTLILPGNSFKLEKIDQIQISQKVTLSTQIPPTPWHRGDSLLLEIALTNPYGHNIYPHRGGLPLSIKEHYEETDCLDDNSHLWLINPPDVWPAESTITFQAMLKIPDELSVGKHTIFLCIQTGNLPLAYASKAMPIELVK